MSLSRAQRAFARANDRQFGPQFGVGGKVWDVYRPNGADPVSYTLLGTWSGWLRRVTITAQRQDGPAIIAEEQWVCHGTTAEVRDAGDLIVGTLATFDLIVSREDVRIAALLGSAEPVVGYERWQVQPCAQPIIVTTPAIPGGMRVGGLIPATYGASYGG